MLLTLVLAAALSALMTVAGTVREAQAALPENIVFASNRTTGKGVDNPTGDREIFTMNPNGTGVKQLTFNVGNDVEPALSPDGKKIAYMSQAQQTSNPQGDWEVDVMNALDGSANTNLTDNGVYVDDSVPVLSADSQKIAYQSSGAQTSNPEGDDEVYVMNAPDGTGKKNLSNTYLGVDDFAADFSPDGQEIAYTSRGTQSSNPEGDSEVYVMNAADGSGQKNLTSSNTYAGDSSPHFSSDGQKIAYTSSGVQASNPEGESEVYVMNALDGTGQKNLSNTGGGLNDVGPVFSPDGQKIAYLSKGVQTSNPEGDYEIYRMNALDGSGKKNLTNNDVATDESPEWGR